MKKRQYKSVKQFKDDIERIKNLTEGLDLSVNFLEKASHISPFKENFKSVKEQYPELLDFSKERIKNIYELGFIRLFASFENFMYEFIKELYYKFPGALPLDRKISIGDILEWKTQKSIREFIVDHIAIENSYDLLTWERTLKGSFGIDVFQDKENKEAIEILNICRNSILHSGGKFNSKIERDFRRIAGNPSDRKKTIFEVTKLDVFDEAIFSKVIYQFNIIINHLEKNNA